MEIVSVLIGFSTLVAWLALTFTFTQLLVALLPLTVWSPMRYLLMTPLAAVSAATIAGTVGGLLDWLNKSIAKELLFRKPASPPIDPAVQEKQHLEESFGKLCEWTNDQLKALQERKSEYQPKRSTLVTSISLELDMLSLSLRHCVPENARDAIAYLFGPGAARRLIEVAPNDYWLAFHLRAALRNVPDGQPHLPISLQRLHAAEEKVREELLYGVSNKGILKQSPRQLPAELLAEYVLRGLIMIKRENHLPTGRQARVEVIWNPFVAINEKVVRIDPKQSP